MNVYKQKISIMPMLTRTCILYQYLTRWRHFLLSHHS